LRISGLVPGRPELRGCRIGQEGAREAESGDLAVPAEAGFRDSGENDGIGNHG
jgi:hypothetical protein